MFHKDFIIQEIEKLAELDDEYAEILLLDETPPAPAPQQEADPASQQEEPQAGTSGDQSQATLQPQEEGGEPPSKRTRSAKPKSVKRPATPKGYTPPTPAERFRGVEEAQAAAYNLTDLKEVVELTDFLQKNGGWELFITPKNGQCLWASFLKGIDVPEEYRASHLRFQFVYFCVQNHAFTFKRLRVHIMAEYGHQKISREEYLRRSQGDGPPLSDQEIARYQKPGPFSFCTFLKYMLQDDAWGDESVIGLIGMMWQITISMIQIESTAPQKGKAHKFIPLDFRHKRPLKKVDVLLVFVGDNHYLGTCKYHSLSSVQFRF